MEGTWKQAPQVHPCLAVACHSNIAEAQGAHSGLSEAEHYRGVAARPSRLWPPQSPTERTVLEQPSPVALLAALAVGLAAFPGNPAQAVLAPSSLLNLPFETTARSLSAMPSSPGTGPKRVHAHLPGWAGKISEPIGGPRLGPVRAEQAAFHPGSAGSPGGPLALSLPAKARP